MAYSTRSRRLLLSSSIVLIVVCGAYGQSWSADSGAVRKVLDDQVAAWNTGDIDGYMRGYWASDSTLFVSGGSLLRGHRTVTERYKKNYATRELMGVLTFGELSFRPLSKSAVLVQGVWKLQRDKDSPWGRFTLIVEKKQEGWKVTHDHTSSGT